MSPLRFGVFETLIAVERTPSGWSAYPLGADGKRMFANFVVPEFIAEDELCQYLADLLHERASPVHPGAFQLA